MTNWNEPEYEMIEGEQALEILRNFMPRPLLMFSYDEPIVKAQRHLHLPDAIVVRVPVDAKAAMENGVNEDTPMRNMLMMSIGSAQGVLSTLVIDEKDVVVLRDMLSAWLDYPKEAVLSLEEGAVWTNSSLAELHSNQDIRFRYGLFGTEWREWDEANDWVDHAYHGNEDEVHDAWELPDF